VDSGGSWSKQAELPAGTTPEAISANGDTLVGDSNGREVVFVRSGEAWSKQATLGEAGSAAISADGNTALVHFSKDLAGVFTRSGETWSESATLAPSRTLRRGCGGSEPAVLSADGDLALLGVPGYDGCNGGVVVFAYTGTTWKRSREILRGNAHEDAFGIRIALSENEETALVTDSGGNVWTFARRGEKWVNQGVQVKDREGVDEIGCGVGEVALTGDGSTELNVEGFNCRPVKLDVFTRSAKRWGKSETLTFREQKESEGPPEPPVVSESGDTVMVNQEFDYYAASPIFRTTVWTR